jgi:hypothetical protein
LPVHVQGKKKKKEKRKRKKEKENIINTTPTPFLKGGKDLN